MIGSASVSRAPRSRFQFYFSSVSDSPSELVQLNASMSAISITGFASIIVGFVSLFFSNVFARRLE